MADKKFLEVLYKNKIAVIAIASTLMALVIISLIVFFVSRGGSSAAGGNRPGSGSDTDNPLINMPGNNSNISINVIVEPDTELNIDGFYGFNAAGIALVRKDDKFGFMDENYRIVVPFIYDKVRWVASDEYINVQMNGRWGIVDSHGKLVVPCTNEGINDISIFGDAFIVNNGNKYGAISRVDSSIVIPFEYDRIIGLSGNNFLLIKDGEAGVYEIVND